MALWAVYGTSLSEEVFKTREEAEEYFYSVPRSVIGYDGEVSLSYKESGDEYWTVVEIAEFHLAERG